MIASESFAMFVERLSAHHTLRTAEIENCMAGGPREIHLLLDLRAPIRPYRKWFLRMVACSICSKSMSGRMGVGGADTEYIQSASTKNCPLGFDLAAS